MKRLWLPLTYLSFKKAGESVRGHFDFLKWFTRLIADGNIEIPAPPIVTVTKAEADTLIINSALVVGQNYKITGVDVPLYGGTDIILTAVTTNEFSPDGQGIFYTPKYNLGVLDDWNGAYDNYGIWNNTRSFSIGDTTIWGGYHWTNLTGVVGSSVNAFQLDATNWVRIEYNPTDYNMWVDVIKYDMEQDVIYHREDCFGNIVSTSVLYSLELADNTYGWGYERPIKAFQWGNSRKNFSEDEWAYRGVERNHVIDSFVHCINYTGRYMQKNHFLNETYVNQGSLSNAIIYYNVFNRTELYNMTLGYLQSNFCSNFNFIGVFSEATNPTGGITYCTLLQGSLSATLLQNSAIYQCYLSGGSSLSQLHFTNTTIQKCTLDGGSRLQDLTMINSSVTNCTFANYSYIRFNTTGTLTSKTITNTTFSGVDATPNISAATIIFTTYPKSVTLRQDATPVISYVNNSNVQVITAITT